MGVHQSTQSETSTLTACFWRLPPVSLTPPLSADGKLINCL